MSMIQQPLTPKQLQFIRESTKTWNLAHGAVRSGKTVGTVFRFLQACYDCPGSKIYIVGHTFDTAVRNVVNLILHSQELAIFRPFCSWSGKKLHFCDKSITILGAKDEGALGSFQGDTYDLVYCDEMTLYPDSIIDMIDTRISKGHSKGFAAMNPVQPSHRLKGWIDKAEAGDPNYYSLHFVLDDNTFLSEAYKNRVRSSSTGLFYKRNILGLWCLAEGAIFEFFDRKIHVVSKPPAAAEYWVAAIDYGASNPFACVLLGVSTGRHTQTGSKMWVDKEYYWDPKVTNRQKTNSEFADDIQQFLEPYAIKALYCDPSAAAFKIELRRRNIHVVDANNEVLDGITMMTSEMRKGNLVICSECKNTIREVEGYVWDSKAAEKGWDEPLKKNDHAVDALRYIIATHRISSPSQHTHSAQDYLRNRFSPTR